MADYMRKIFYLRKWDQGILVSGAGYVRLERKRDSLVLSLRVEERVPKESQVFGIFRGDEQWNRIEMGKFHHPSDSWEAKIRLTGLPEGESGEGIVGVYVATGGRYWAGEEAGAHIPFEEFFVPYREESPEETVWEESPEDVQKKVTEPEIQVAEMYPFEDDEMAWCREIRPEDLMNLPAACWRMGNNSFLLQGYYSYRHLLYAGDGSRCYIGVPGQFHRREQYLARRFGFPRFKGARRKRITMGDFGYWLQDIGGDGDDQR